MRYKIENPIIYKAKFPSNPSSISQGIKVEIGEKKNEPKNIFRGEAQEAKRTEGIKPLYNYNGNFWVKK